MHKYDYILLALAALTLAPAFMTSPEGAATMDRLRAPADMHFSRVERNTAMVPDDDFPAH
jgi:hypothetical protein